MTTPKRGGRISQAKQKLQEAIGILKILGFAPKQANDTAGYALLAMLNLSPVQTWSDASRPLMGITPIIEYVRQHYKVNYAPNTRETIRDEAIKYFVEFGVLVKNPDQPDRPTNSGKTVYQIESSAHALLQSFGTSSWERLLKKYLDSRQAILAELARHRVIARIPVVLPSGKIVSLSPGGQNPLIKSVIDEFCPRYSPGGFVTYIGDAENKFLHLESAYLKKLGVVIAAAAKMPDVVVHDTKRNWLLLIEAVASAGPVDAKRRKELKELFKGCKAGLVFVSAFTDKLAFGKFYQQISWETEVWFANEPDHILHFNGERFLGPYPDVLPAKLKN